MLVDDHAQLGGSLRWRKTRIDDLEGIDWTAARERDLRAAGVRIMTQTTAVGLYDHNAVVLVEKSLPPTKSANGECLWQVRAQDIVLASGAIERPLLFENNDRPGVMLADAVLRYLRNYAVRCGERVVVATSNDSAYEVAHELTAAGAHCVVVDTREHSELAAPARGAGIDVRLGDSIDSAFGTNAGRRSTAQVRGNARGRPYCGVRRLDATHSFVLPCSRQAALGRSHRGVWSQGQTLRACRLSAPRMAFKHLTKRSNLEAAQAAARRCLALGRRRPAALSPQPSALLRQPTSGVAHPTSRPHPASAASGSICSMTSRPRTSNSPCAKTSHRWNI